MVLFELSPSFFLCLVPLLFWFIKHYKSILLNTSSSSSSSSKPSKLPRSYPLVGSYFEMSANLSRYVEWTSEALKASPSSTFVLHLPLGNHQILTANPSNVRHILKTQSCIYQKGRFFKTTFMDLFGNSMFNADGEMWRSQRHVSSHEFSTQVLCRYIQSVVDPMLSHRLLPILSAAAMNGTVLDLQDILQRFAMDNICQFAFGYDPACLLPSLPQNKFAEAYETAIRVSNKRFASFHPLVWKTKRLLNIGSEKQLKSAIKEVRKLTDEIVQKKKQQIESVDILSRFLCSENHGQDIAMDVILGFIMAGRDTTSAALLWFFWALARHPDVENEILREINEKPEEPIYEDLRDMVYTHASLCESMRLYPPVPFDMKEAAEDDVLPDGTVVKKGMKVTYHPYAMGRMEELWGKDWAEYRPERWLEKDPAPASAALKWRFVGRDPYTYPVFQAGPRVCLGKDLALLQMKRVVTGVFRRFRVVPALEEGVEPVYISCLTAKMKGGFPVRIEERVEATFGKQIKQN
ncbi:cytochrome P450 94A2-like [Diospyros lotus]|uniref:cytochrome P450 94A2-like n=1 Tax=Diospyros lotus TaxID=55363 RepID=UPI00224D3627|nr:cytochrome P450 94A2-like [Diospyros lotus]